LFLSPYKPGTLNSLSASCRVFTLDIFSLNTWSACKYEHKEVIFCDLRRLKINPMVYNEKKLQNLDTRKNTLEALFRQNNQRRIQRYIKQLHRRAKQ